MTDTPHSAHLDFQLLFDQWEKRADVSKADTCLYRDLINRIKGFPDLNQSPVDPEALKKEGNFLGFGLILGSLFPMSGQEEKRILALSAPFDMQPIYSTPAFKELFLNEDCSIKIPENLDVNRINFGKMLNMYSRIVDQVYGIKMNQGHPLVFQYRAPNGINRHFQIRMNFQYVKVIAKGPLPNIHDKNQICTSTSPDHYDLENWKKILPLSLFEFRGFLLLEADEITVSQSVATLNEAVLNQEEISPREFADVVEDSVKSLIGISDIKVGLASLQQVKGKLVFSKNRLANSYILKMLCEDRSDVPYTGVINFLSAIQKPVLLNELSAENPESKFMSKVVELGVKEVILYPLKYKGNLVGLLEICSLRQNAFEPIMLHHLDMLAPSLSIAFNKQAELLDSKIKSIIRKKFTAIHPVVEWKFDEIALDYVLDEEQGKTPEIPPINFQEVFPLYAAVDVKNSSQERNNAIQRDLLIQLGLAKNVLEKARTLHYLPLLDRMLEKIGEFERRIQLILASEEEVRITEFFMLEFEPTFKHLSETYPDLQPSVQEYFQAVDPQIGVVYIHRKAFEESLKEINLLVGQYLDREETKIQRMFPHYFEKFKTDGIEYNIYIGQSLVKDRVFDPIYLKNLRLWQLQTLIDIVNLVQEKSPSLDVSLQTTQLILAHSNPLTISFRIDERKFDVEGAYNIRYEIIKKRIDKALIKGTNERLVQPGKIAIVYSQPKDAKEYLDFIQFFQNRQLLKESVEELELDDMQGVHGLKAIRVAVVPKRNLNQDGASELVSESEER
ncbi:GAF domain-containing protein [Algoriphagus aestuariicola]|uniref:GAF domain-containing protein n=1 Tax=Algoriphagus aestuariicola TaxID=1852016 RepID=A0ABS3BQM5_9BACT|nr:GAF domain-containing protein [Algoriphagus aestuariicola]MBN7801458.1 GAF domain-containing protein [Algoriphagus aestuariicola]